MKGDSTTLSREQRLAQRLRENLHRRKAQARAISAQDPGQDNDTLPKVPPTG